MSDHARVLFFANLREKTGVRETTVEFTHGSVVAEIKKLILEIYPDLKPNMETIIIAMNHEFAFDENPVPDGAELALFPPVSGGTDEKKTYPTIIALDDREIDLQEILEQITLPTTGAACIFSGIVRGVTSRGKPRRTERLDYEAYQAMAMNKMQKVADEIRTRWEKVEGIAIVQRIGMLTPGTVSVIIACSASHRDSGIFEAARYGIERLKEIVPIWKKEIGRDGETWIEGEYIPQRGE